MPSDRSPVLASMPATRRSILLLVKKRGEASAGEIATALGITLSAVRQHMAGLTDAGLVVRRPEPKGPGRPTLRYSLAAAGEALFPRFYAELTNELLDYVGEEDPVAVERAFARRRQRRIERARARLGNRPFADRVAELTVILDEDGYLAEFESLPNGGFLVTEFNCAILGVAERYGLACSTEIEFLRAALPDARVERVAHRMAGAHVCAYEIRRPRRALGPRSGTRGGRDGAAARGGVRAGSGAGRRTRATGSGS